jgi:AraC-like DNA-binding protein
MAKGGSLSRVVEARAAPLSRAHRITLHWDGRSSVCHGVELHPFPVPGPPSAFQAKGPPATGHRARPYWTTSEIGLVPGLSPQAINWEEEAARMTFDLDRALLADTTHGAALGATAELVWVDWPEEIESHTPAVYPTLMMHATDRSLQADRVTIVPSLPAHDRLLQHMALVLQAALGGEDAEGRLYAESLTDALVVHFLRRYATMRPPLRAVTGGLSPYKLRRTTAYIQAHLAQALSLATLAAVAQTSPAHFARLFKHATGLAPHQYVITCRMAHAKRLLAETDVSLIDIGLQVGCTDQSHFTALFRTHVALTPKAYRAHTRQA